METVTATIQTVEKYVGQRIRERRTMLGLTQQQLAEMIGVTYQQAHKYERGINRVSAGRLFEIARVLGVDIGFFYEGLDSQDSRLNERQRMCLDLARNFTRISNDRHYYDPTTGEEQLWRMTPGGPPVLYTDADGWVRAYAKIDGSLDWERNLGDGAGVKASPVLAGGFVIIAESHISVHTFPEHGYVWVDIFSCKEFETDGATERIMLNAPVRFVSSTSRHS